MQHVSSPVPDDLSRFADVPPELRALVLKCLEKNPERRYFSAADVDTELAVIQPTVTRSENAVKRFQRLWAPAEALVSELESALDAIVTPDAEEEEPAPVPGGPPTTVPMARGRSVLTCCGRAAEAAARWGSPRAPGFI